MPLLRQPVTQAGLRQVPAECGGRFFTFPQNHPDDHTGDDQTNQYTELELRQLAGACQADHAVGHIAEADHKSQRQKPVVQIQRGFVAEW